MTNNKADTFLSAFVVPILPYLLEVRIGLRGDDVQSSISTALSVYGLTMFILSPVAGIFIDKFSNRKWPLIISLLAQMTAIAMTALSTNSKTAQSARPANYLL